MSLSNEKIFEQEKEVFESLLPELLNRYKGKYVVIHNKKPVLFGKDKVNLAKKAYQKFGYIPLYIGLVDEKLETIHLRSPRVYR